MDTTTALAFVIPDEYHNKINEVRSKQDRAYPRWMPHINFLFPFKPAAEFADIASKLLTGIKMSPFEVSFKSLGHFSQGKNVTIHLKPDKDSESKLTELYTEIRRLLPEVPVKREDFHPHLTVAQCKKSELAATLVKLNAWLGQGITVKFDGLSLLQRTPQTDDKMVVKNLIYIKETI